MDGVYLVLPGSVLVLCDQPLRQLDEFDELCELGHLREACRHDLAVLGVGDHVREILLHRADDVLRAVELLRLDVAGVLAEHRLALAHVVAPEADPELRADGHDPFSRAVERPRVGREPDVLLLHGRVDINPLEVLRLSDLVADGRGERLRNHVRHADLPRPLAPPAHDRLVRRWLVLEELAAAEVLPVGVLDPVVQHLLVAQVEHVLQKREPDHHPHGDRRTPVVLAVGRLEHFLKPLPVNRLLQQDEFVPLEHEIPQHHLEEVGLDGL